MLELIVCSHVQSFIACIVVVMAALAALHALLGEREGEGPSSDMKAFREVFAKSKNILVLSGAGMSAESGVPTFRLEVAKDAQAHWIIRLFLFYSSFSIDYIALTL